ncbi:glycosyltransferase [Variovorax sp.]|uniref:glycosyltransferase n=1 Tax=Variovorax sp. TaxID=1871043 RepID=UPI002D3A0E2D|nr:glycosyltransferase [Variovorax sp.]HYP86312.1 glycosyltransferase [Variovorax sp.]
MSSTPPAGVAPMRHVVCMKWGTKYGPDYVNKLYAMARRHMSGEFRFVCLTDDAVGIRPEVDCFPIPPVAIRPELPGVRDRAWRKLTTFSADLRDKYGLYGPALFLDLDLVVVGSLDEFFDEPGEFLIIKDYRRPWRVTGNSSVYRWQIGELTDVLDYFRENEVAIRKRFRNEQTFLSDYLHGKGKLRYWPSAWCPSFKYDGIPLWPSNYWRRPFVPEGAKVMVFHGECNPPDALAGRRNRRFRFIRQATWVAEHWHE